MIFFRDCSMIKDKSYKKSNFFVIIWKIFGFLRKECLHSQVLNPFCDASSFKIHHYVAVPDFCVWFSPAVPCISYWKQFSGLRHQDRFFRAQTAKIRRHQQFLLQCVIFKGVFCIFIFMCIFQHCFICRPSDSTVSEDAGIEPRTVVT